MNGSIKLFQFIHKRYQLIGIYPPRPNQNHSPINSKIRIFLVCLIQLFVFSTIFLLFYATSMFEYGITLYTLSSLALSMTAYLFPIWQMKNILQFHEFCESFIETSKLSASCICIVLLIIVTMRYFTLQEHNQRLITRNWSKRWSD